MLLSMANHPVNNREVLGLVAWKDGRHQHPLSHFYFIFAMRNFVISGFDNLDPGLFNLDSCSKESSQLGCLHLVFILRLSKRLGTFRFEVSILPSTDNWWRKMVCSFNFLFISWSNLTFFCISDVLEPATVIEYHAATLSELS